MGYIYIYTHSIRVRLGYYGDISWDVEPAILGYDGIFHQTMWF